MFWQQQQQQRRRAIWGIFLTLFLVISESSASRIDPKLDFKSEDNLEKYPELGINHKLYNVRVIVDAARPKPRNMDAEEIPDVEGITGGVTGKTKKTFQTNITISVSDEDSANKSGKDDENEDETVENASVPVFKGKRVDPNRNRPETKLFFDYSGSGSREIPPPVFPKTDEDSFRNLNWVYFQPPSAGYWTTAKPRSEDNFIPYGIGFRPSPTPAPYPDYLRVKPCLCKFHDQPLLRNRPEFDRPLPYHRSEEVYFARGSPDHNYSNGGSSRSSTSTGIDDKLDFPFHAK